MPFRKVKLLKQHYKGNPPGTEMLHGESKAANLVEIGRAEYVDDVFYKEDGKKWRKRRKTKDMTPERRKRKYKTK